MSTIINENGVLQSPPSSPIKNIKIPYLVGCIFVFILTAMFLAWSIHYQGGYEWGGRFVDTQMNWHALLSLMGFSFLLAESILTYRVQKTWSRNINKIVHIVSHLVGFVLTTIGLAAIFDTNLEQHFISFHSWIGFGTYLLFIAQFVCGILTHLIPILPQFIGSYHAQCGTIIYGLAALAIATGLLLRISITAWIPWINQGELLANFIGLFFIIFSGLVLFMVIHPQYK